MTYSVRGYCAQLAGSNTIENITPSEEAMKRQLTPQHPENKDPDAATENSSYSLPLPPARLTLENFHHPSAVLSNHELTNGLSSPEPITSLVPLVGDQALLKQVCLLGQNTLYSKLHAYFFIYLGEMGTVLFCFLCMKTFSYESLRPQ